MVASVFVPMISRLYEFFAEYDIEVSCEGVHADTAQGLTDIHFLVEDPSELTRITTWLIPKLKESIGKDYNPEITTTMTLHGQTSLLCLRFREVSS